MLETTDYSAPLPAGRYPGCPVVAVGAVVFNTGRVLLVRRGQPPSDDLWAIPGGKVRLGESLQAAAEREILEETGLVIRAGRPVHTFDVIERDDRGRVLFHYLIVDLDAAYAGGSIQAGDDAREARWVGPDEIRRLRVSPQTVDLLQCQFGFGGGTYKWLTGSIKYLFRAGRWRYRAGTVPRLADNRCGRSRMPQASHGARLSGAQRRGERK